MWIVYGAITQRVGLAGVVDEVNSSTATHTAIRICRRDPGRVRPRLTESLIAHKDASLRKSTASQFSHKGPNSESMNRADLAPVRMSHRLARNREGRTVEDPVE